jgi:hypothetical protein
MLLKERDILVLVSSIYVIDKRDILQRNKILILRKQIWQDADCGNRVFILFFLCIMDSCVIIISEWYIPMLYKYWISSPCLNNFMLDHILRNSN